MLNKLVSIKNNKPSKRLGRGLGSGKGTTSGRGTKGQKSRSGYNIPRSFEGGQTPLIQRLPKKSGFRSYQKENLVINIAKIEKYFSDGDKVNLKTLKEKGLIGRFDTRVKILGPGNLTKKLRFQDVSLNKNLLAQYKASAEKPVVESVEKSNEKAVEKKAEKSDTVKTNIVRAKSRTPKKPVKK